MRTFIAVEIDASIKEKLARIRELGLVKGGSVRWVPADRMHLTLKFLGEIDPSSVPLVTRAMQDASRAVEPFDLEFRNLGFFPNRTRPRVFWAGIHDARKSLEILFRSLEMGLLDLGFEREARPFRPHLTLARFRDRVKGMIDLKERENEVFGSQIVKEIVLIKSELRPQGPLYTPLSTVTLKE